MAVQLTIHYDNLAGLARPHLRLWHAGANPVDLAPTGGDEFGPLWELPTVRPELTCPSRPARALPRPTATAAASAHWSGPTATPAMCGAGATEAFVYPVRPADPDEPARAFLGCSARVVSRPGWGCRPPAVEFKANLLPTAVLFDSTDRSPRPVRGRRFQRCASRPPA